MNAVADKFEQFEWLTHGITAKSPQFGDEGKGTGEKPLDYQDRLGAIASMDTQLEKSVTSVIVFGNVSEMDYQYIRSHLALIMATNSKLDKRKEPQKISIQELSMLIARIVIDFSMNPELEKNFTAKGRLYYAGIRSWQMDDEQYRKTWKQYENLMVLALESAIDSASKTIENYRKNTYKEFKA
ncbi:hypothetical protein [Acinetobacter sp. CFCC 10889]|uniref:hypothetical protein n=1 Tax=Acinetobacter sp. CFCC 10889 TaxID=1775557 RepID=UPI000DCFE0B5|nr:hypothetical protein [Acinetobacter sp. CFCC 10889]